MSETSNKTTVVDNPAKDESKGPTQAEVNLALIEGLNRLVSAGNAGAPVAPAVGLFESDIPGSVFRFGTGNASVLKNCHGDVVDENGKVKVYVDGTVPGKS